MNGTSGTVEHPCIHASGKEPGCLGCLEGQVMRLSTENEALRDALGAVLAGLVMGLMQVAPKWNDDDTPGQRLVGAAACADDLLTQLDRARQ